LGDLAVRNFCHRIDVIDHNEGDARGLGMSRPDAQARDKEAGGETAKGGHDGEARFERDTAHAWA